MRVLVIDRSKTAANEMVKYLSALGHTAIAVNRVEDAVETLAASLTWEEQFAAIILTADPLRSNPILWFLKYLNNRHSEVGVIPTLLQSEESLYEAEGDKVDLRTLSNQQFPFVWYHELNLKKEKRGYFQRFLKERVMKTKGPTR